MVLKDKVVLISVSATSSQEKTAELEKTLLTLCDKLSKHQARIAYGGNLDPDGFTFKIERKMADRHLGPKSAFIHIIDQPTFLASSFEQLGELLGSREKLVETQVCLGTNVLTLGWRRGRLSFDRGRDTTETLDRSEFDAFQRRYAVQPEDGYTNSRRAKADIVDACVAIGGKTGIVGNSADKFFGRLPGIAEEVYYTLCAGRPVVPVASLGGCAHDVAVALRIIRDSSGTEVQHQVGFEQAMTALVSVSGKIPEHVRQDLQLAAGPHTAAEISQAVVNVISRWNAGQPQGGNLYTGM
ncbi:hypothetical protein [Rhizobium sp. Rhizsp82]|uniref:hypothetical protein n=1 Tax=Rhizobium sp. Rhizsp82 TaxID=3243057 RepID=UPI0039B6DE79